MIFSLKFYADTIEHYSLSLHNRLNIEKLYEEENGQTSNEIEKKWYKSIENWIFLFLNCLTKYLNSIWLKVASENYTFNLFSHIE